MSTMKDLMIGDGPQVPDTGEPISDTLRFFLKDCRDKGLREKTIIWYEAKLREIFKNLLDRPVDCLTDAAVFEMMDVLKATKSPETCNGYFRALKRFLNFCIEFNRLEHTNPGRIKKVKTDTKIPTVLTQDEVGTLLASFDEKTLYGLRNKVITQLLLDTGMRVGECLSIKLSDVDLPVITLRHTKGRSDRQVRMSEGMVSLMRKWLKVRMRAGDDGYLFPSEHTEQLSLSRYAFLLKQQAVKAGIRKNVHPHTMRFTYISAMNAAGVDVESIRLSVGHATPHMVLHYATVMPVAAMEASANHSPIAQLAERRTGKRGASLKGQGRRLK